MEKILELTDIRLRAKVLFCRWLIFGTIVCAIAASLLAFLLLESFKIAAVIPIVLVPAINLPITLRLIQYEDERMRRIRKYEKLYSIVRSSEDLHQLN